MLTNCVPDTNSYPKGSFRQPCYLAGGKVRITHGLLGRLITTRGLALNLCRRFQPATSAGELSGTVHQGPDVLRGLTGAPQQ